jgi:hypothetical protein
VAVTLNLPWTEPKDLGTVRLGAQSSLGLRDAIPIGHMGCHMKLIDARKSANYCRADEAFLRHIIYQEGQPRQSSRPDGQEHVIPRLSLFRGYQ